MIDHPSHVSDISFDRAFAQQLPAAEQQRMNAHLAQCPRCRERQSHLAEERAAFLVAAPDWREYAAQHGPAAPRKPKRTAHAKLWMSLSAATALAAACLLVSTRLGTPSAINTRIKGGAQLGFYVKHGAQVARGRPDQVVQPGDVLRFTYSSPTPTYFALLGRDDRRASLFHPKAKQAVALAKGADVALDFGVEIDAEPGQERIYALFCSEPMLLAPLLAALERTAEFSAPQGCTLRELRLRKVVP